MFWALDLGDFLGSHCGEGKYPPMNSVKNYHNGGAPSPSIPRHHRPPPHTTMAPLPPPPPPQQLSFPLPYLLKDRHHPPLATRTRQLRGLLHLPPLRDPHHSLPRGPQLGSARQLEHGRATPEWITGA